MDLSMFCELWSLYSRMENSPVDQQFLGFLEAQVALAHPVVKMSR